MTMKPRLAERAHSWPENVADKPPLSPARLCGHFYPTSESGRIDNLSGIDHSADYFLASMASCSGADRIAHEILSYSNLALASGLTQSRCSQFLHSS